METKGEETLAHANGALHEEGKAALDLPTSIGEPVTLMADLAPAGGVNGSGASGSAAHVPATTGPTLVSGGAAPKIVRGMESTSRRARFRGMTERGFQPLGRSQWPSGSGQQHNPTTDGTSKLALQLKPIFGEAKTFITDANDPAFPLCLRQATEETLAAWATNKVVAVWCAQGLAALVITDPNQLSRVQSHPALGAALLTAWSGAWLHWIWTDVLGEAEAPTSTPAGLGEGVVLIRNGLLPVARYEPGAEVLHVHLGKIPRVPLADLRWAESTDNDASATGRGPSAPNAPQQKPKPVTTQVEASDTEADPVKALSSQFGQDRVLSRISLDDKRLALTLKPAPRLQGEWGSKGSPGRKLIAVECGIGNGDHSAAVILHDQESKVDFLTRNPKLANGLRTKWGAAEIAWLRILGPSPRNLQAGPITWFTKGLVPVAVEGQAREGLVTQEGLIPVIQFSALQWAPSTKAMFESDEIEELFGPIVVPVQTKKFNLIDVHFAEMLLRRLRLRFDENTDSFSRYRLEHDSWEKLSHLDLSKLITNGLLEIAGKFPHYFPFWEITRKRVENIHWLLEMRAAESPGQNNIVDGFFDEALKACAGAKVTSSELFEAYRTYCRVRDLPLCTEAFFHRQATDKLGRASHCFGKNGSQRGRFGWQLQQDVIYNAEPELDQRGPGQPA